MSLNPEDVKARLRPFGIVFEKSLRDLIKGIRANKEPEAQSKFLQNAINECRQEVKSSDMDLKTMAILKLCYLEMYGFDMSWANFNVLEVMSSSKFQQKRVGYLAASQAFRTDDDVLMLTTNLLKKDLNSATSVDVGVALSGVSSIVTPALAQDVTEDIIKMLNHSKPYIRKKAVLALYKIFLQYPEALRSSFDRLCDKLEDSDDSVMAATVTVICELAKKNPKNFVNLAPRLYDILSTTQNNWVIIRLLKLFASLAKIEPRLNVRLIPKLLDIMKTTRAMSLIYECINCIVVGEMLDDSNISVAQICVDFLQPFFTNADANLQFVGLLTLNKIAKIQPDIISIQSEVIIPCLNHADLSIRKQALNLLEYIISEDNLEEIVSVLVKNLLFVQDNEEVDATNSNKPVPVLSDSFKVNIVNRILDVCIMNSYSNISDFDWFVSTLSDLVRIAAEYSLYEVGYRVGVEIRNVLVKIPSIRSAVINDHIIELLMDKFIVGNLLSFLPEALWAVGEYASLIRDPNSLLLSLVDVFKSRQNIIFDEVDNSADQDYDQVILVLIPALVKIFNAYSNQNNNYMWNFNEKQKVTKQLGSLIGFLTKTSVSKNFNVQERSIEFLEFLKLLKDSLLELPDDSLQAPLLLTAALPSLFDSWELNPIGKDVQKKIAVPEDLDLDAEIYPVNRIYQNLLENDPEFYLNYRNSEYHSDSESEISNSDDEFKEYSNPLLGVQEDGFYHDSETRESLDYSNNNTQDIEKRRLERLERQKYDPFYLSDEKITRQSPTPELLLSGDDSASLFSGTVSKKKQIDPSAQLKKKKKKLKPVVLTEEVIADPAAGASSSNLIEVSSGTGLSTLGKTKSKKKNILKIDTSALENLDINAESNNETAEVGDVGYIVKDSKLQKYTAPISNDGEEQLLIKPKKKTKKKSLKTKTEGGSAASIPNDLQSGDATTKKKKKSLKTKPKKTDAEGNIIEVKRKSKKKSVQLD